MPLLVLPIATILLLTIATHALGHLIGVAATPPARVYTISGHTTGPCLLDVVAVKRVGVVPIDVDVLECAQSCDGAARCGRGGTLSKTIIKPKRVWECFEM